MDAMIHSVLTPTRAQIDAAIRETASDYLEGWNEGDSLRVGRSLHPDLAKRIVRPNDSLSSAWPPGDRLDELTALRHAQLSQHEPVADYNRWTEVATLDRFENAASLKMGGTTGLGTRNWSGEYQHHVFWNGRWLILHVLWGLRPRRLDDIDEDAAITRTAVEYVESFYDCDGARIERCLHPHLVRRTVIPNGAPSSHLRPGDYLYHMSAETLIQLVASGAVHRPEVDRRVEVTILDRAANAASVRVDASAWIDYLHLCKWNGRWAILNSLWSKRPAV